MTTLSDRLRATRRPLVGRQQLLADLGQWVLGAGPPVTFLHGIPGIGKTTLVAELANRTRQAGVTTIELDCVAIEPTDAGLFDALSRATGKRIDSIEAVSEHLPQEVTLVTFDGYETWRLLDTWFRQRLLPAMPDATRILLASRFEPAGPWRYEPEWQGACQVTELGPLNHDEALELLEAGGLPADGARRVNSIARGHPLAIALAASTLRDRPDAPLDKVAMEGLINALAAFYLEAAPDRATRTALEAASVTRRSTETSLAAQLGSAEEARRAYDRLAALPFVRANWDGLAVHESVKQAAAAQLRASRPTRHRELRLAAWRGLQDASRGAGEAELWRYTADLLYLLESQPLRDGFFPRMADPVSLEPAVAADFPEIRAISERHDGPESTEILEAWWRWYPQGFKVARDRAGRVVGFRYSAVSTELPPALIEEDPVLGVWFDDIAASECPDLPAFLLRRWLSWEEGDLPGEVQGLSWIDCKSTYLKLRPQLGHVYVSLHHVEPYEEAIQQLGFSHMTDREVWLDGEQVHLTVMHFGPGSVDAWLSHIAAQELGIDPTGILDESARQLLIEGVRVPLTPLEFAVMQVLVRDRGRAVSHAELVEQVWGYAYTGESNVDAVVIRGLRAKLGPSASLVETVRGVGYRLREG